MAVKRTRQAAVAGYFYPKESEELREELGRLTRRRSAADRSSCETACGGIPTRQRGAIVPHAGFQYSGRVAGETFSQLEIPKRCVILGPNHSGWGAAWSLMAEGAYATPLGEVPIDEPLARALLETCPLLAADHVAHKAEHAIEVELPFLQWLGPKQLSIVPLVIGSDSAEEYHRVAAALARLISQSGEPVLLLASSDFTHYEPEAVAVEKDSQVIGAIQALDTSEFLRLVRGLPVRMCGYGPVACVLSAARQLGATGATLVRYATSAEAGGDPHSVVGYAGIIVN
jgi:AmmeMemoRadiSam system protein B